MELTNREWWTAIHGMMFGALFLLAFAGGLAGLYSLRPAWLTVSGLQERLVRLNIGTMVMALAAWGTVLTGTWIVYPWYRAGLPSTLSTALKDGAAKLGIKGTEFTPEQLTQILTPEQMNLLQAYPRNYLLSNEHLAGWHDFGMEWKEHIAWIAPIIATAVAFIVWRYGRQLAIEGKLRSVLISFFVFAFAAAGVAGLFGAFITKAAPVH